MDVVFIGAGNLATQLALELNKKGFNIVEIYSKTIHSAELLANQVQAKAITSIKKIYSEADLYIFSIKDYALNEILKEILPNKGLWVHTSGSLPLGIFRGVTNNYGVLYPLQTFTKERFLDFSDIPFFIEGNSKNVETEIYKIAKNLSDKVYFLSSEKRKYVHLAGVFACNFVNHMYVVADNILKSEDIPTEVLLPIIKETAAKIQELEPQKAQTGPAVRYDENIMKKQLSLIQDEDLKELYKLISKNIHKTNTK